MVTSNHSVAWRLEYVLQKVESSSVQAPNSRAGGDCGSHRGEHRGLCRAPGWASGCTLSLPPVSLDAGIVATNPGVNQRLTAGPRSPTTPGPRGWAEAALSESLWVQAPGRPRPMSGWRPQRRHPETRALCRARAIRPVGAPPLHRRSAGFRGPGPARQRPTPSCATGLGLGSPGLGRQKRKEGGSRGRRKGEERTRPSQCALAGR